ncbi:hypothetical protein KC19_12G041700 [Ceratodon purpureus]|uniref:Protein kinase domain-containing protein n=1 Tax=Ceratodon purpureus TaxID=3225 RepID=A0A8T0G7I0_CERPU|nr:hypothetical protein KC19_12G041700 [Ceratodon purpureus]
MTLHLELAQGSRRSADGVSYGAPFIDGCEKLRETQPTKLLGVDGWAELNRSQFIRLSRALGESFPDLKGMQVQILKDLCLYANCSEEFFLSVSKDQWLRTSISGEKDPNLLFSSEVIEKQCRTLVSSITIQSIVVPWHLYWPKLQEMKDKAGEVASERVYFPSTVLEVALSEDKSLIEQLREWEKKKEECAIAKQCHDSDDDEGKASRPFWNIGLNDVKAVKKVAGGSQAVVGKIIWRGGLFARKVFNQKHIFDTELEVVRRVSHPHIVYSFGVSSSPDKTQYSLLMELLDGDLSILIEERIRLRGYKNPPFSRIVSVDILLQIAKAMAHMHDLDEPVIHGDLKPQNILVSHCEILGDVGQYFVKVADFGSAKILKSNSSSTFYPEGGTTRFAAPEVLKAVSERTPIPDDPKKIDVYGFGILAFQVLTGLVPYEKFPSLQVSKKPYQGVSHRGDLKKGVIEGTLRPPLREACSRPNFWNDSELLTLVESCWDPESSARPHFSKVIDQLESIYNNLIQKQTNGSNVFPLAQMNAIDAPRDQPIIESNVHLLPLENVVDDAPQSTAITRNGSHLPEVEQNINHASSAAQVHPQSVQDKPEKASRKRLSTLQHVLMRWTCVSPTKTI